MSQRYLVATSGLLARKALPALRDYATAHEPEGTFKMLKSLVTQLETIRYHDEDAFYASMDGVMAFLNTKEKAA